MTKRLTLISLALSILFMVWMLLGNEGIAVTQILGVFDYVFGWPLYGLIAVSFILSVTTWYQERTMHAFQYVLYSALAAILTIGTLFYILIQFAESMENF